MQEVQQGMESILKAAPVVPVMVIENVADAVPLARALVKGGLPVLEITLRTKAALECIRAIIAEVEGAIVGAGTVLDGKKLKEAEHTWLRLRRFAGFHQIASRRGGRSRSFRCCRALRRRRNACTSWIAAIASRNSSRPNRRAVSPIFHRSPRPCRR